MPELEYIDISKEKATDSHKEICKEAITRKDLLSIGLDPNQYLNNEKDEIFIKDIIVAAKNDKNSSENRFNKELFYTCKILDAYNKKNKDLYYFIWNQKAN